VHAGITSITAAAAQRRAPELHRGRGAALPSPGALPAPPTACGYSPTTCRYCSTAPAAAQCCRTIGALPPVLVNYAAWIAQTAQRSANACIPS
jgi:hypothetical protein